MSNKIDFRLYLITDRKLFSDKRRFLDAIAKSLGAGVRAIQLREKDMPTRELLQTAYELRELTNKYNAKLFINDRADIAVAAEADGVHLGQSSITPDAVKKAFGNRLLIGASTHSIEEAIDAEKRGVDFITLGPIYETPSKLRYGKPLGIEILTGLNEVIKIPVFAIGGIKLENTNEVLSKGVYGVALITAILASEDITSTTERFMRLLK